jgi:hypothetical protein
VNTTSLRLCSHDPDPLDLVIPVTCTVSTIAAPLIAHPAGGLRRQRRSAPARQQNTNKNTRTRSNQKRILVVLHAGAQVAHRVQKVSWRRRRRVRRVRRVRLRRICCRVFRRVFRVRVVRMRRVWCRGLLRRRMVVRQLRGIPSRRVRVARRARGRLVLAHAR